MKTIPTTLPGLVLFEPEIHRDPRGFLFEGYHQKRYREAGLSRDFVQMNRSRSAKGVLRGLHFQKMHPQGKLVSVPRGEIFDVAVDIRVGSPQFGRWFGTRLDDVHHRQLYIPEGFAHGFCVLSEEADVLYLCTDYYHAGDDGGIAWNDPDLAISWPLNNPSLSEKDKKYPFLRDLKIAG